MKGIYIQASSNSEGNTNKILKQLQKELYYPILDLKEKEIGHFDYDFQNANDDFLPTIKDIAENYDLLIFATPIYWYTMSGILKVFFDRISDCLKTEKEIGRKLRGKKLAVISCGSGPEIFEGFHMPFVQSARYLGMEYMGSIHSWIEEGNILFDKDQSTFLNELA